VSRHLLVERERFGGFTKSFDREAYSVALAEVLSAERIDLVAMAGFGTIVTGSFHRIFPGRVLNTHPELAAGVQGLARGEGNLGGRGR
jgi:phosphoribosylglycinamide formyltransferase-1